MAYYLLKGSTYLTSLQSCITQQQQVRRNIFAYSDRGGWSLSFGYVYVKFEPGPKKLLAVQDENSMLWGGPAGQDKKHESSFAYRLNALTTSNFLKILKRQNFSQHLI